MVDFKQKLNLYKQLTNKSNQDLAKSFGVTILAVSNWINLGAIPREKVFKKIQIELEKFNIILDKTFPNKIEEKLNVLDLCRKKNKKILGLILSRQDLIDEFSLQMTFHSNSLEGSTMTVDDTFNVLFNKNKIVKKSLKEQLEAKNHHETFLFLLDYLKEGKKADEGLCKKLHQKLMQNLILNNGQYRNHSVRITGSFVPTANFLKIEVLIKGVFSRKIVGVEDVAKFHADFEKIHPFSDGNGRVGRLLLAAQLLSLDLSPAIIKTKKRIEYHKYLQEAQLKEDYEKITEFIVDSIFEGYKILN